MVRRSPITTAQQDEAMFYVLEMFIYDDLSPAVISERIQDELNIPLNREAVYPMVREAVRRGYLQLTPPRNRVLANFFKNFKNKGDITVVDTKGSVSGRYVANAGAHVTLDLIKQIAKRRRKEPVHLGLGIGRSTMELVQCLAPLLGTMERPPSLVLHAISPPASIIDPMDNPVSAFGCLREVVPSIEYVSLAVGPIVNAKDYRTMINSKIVKPSFDRAGEIDIVISSLADADDAHGALRGYLDRLSATQMLALDKQGWVGDLQLRPYANHGPIPITTGIRPVMLFELKELVKFAKQKNHYVVLLASKCSNCAQSKARALRPLLREPSLHVWTHLVLDTETANEVMA